VTQLSLVETIISNQDQDVILNKVSSQAQIIQSCSYRKQVISRIPEEVMEGEEDKGANE
jgi:hypothetical protein